MHEASLSPAPSPSRSLNAEDMSRRPDLANAAGRKRRKSKPKPGEDVDETGAKRVYQCKNCQRSYDWNYNLNRHLKYECGKENAFQCSKCGRKFPHKQNCVYHLKRKHKVVCDTIDQYMTSGLVIFRGMASPSGQQAARPVILAAPDQ